MKILEKLSKYNKPCEDGVAWLLSLKTEDLTEIYKTGMEQKQFDWLSWGLTRLLSTANVVKYAKFAAHYADTDVHYNDNTTRYDRAAAAARGAAAAAAARCAAAARYAANAAYYAVEVSVTSSVIYKYILDYGFNLLVKESV